MEAAACGHTAIVEALLKADANPNATDEVRGVREGSYGMTMARRR